MCCVSMSTASSQKRISSCKSAFLSTPPFCQHSPVHVPIPFDTNICRLSYHHCASSACVFVCVCARACVCVCVCARASERASFAVANCSIFNGAVDLVDRCAGGGAFGVQKILTGILRFVAITAKAIAYRYRHRHTDTHTHTPHCLYAALRMRLLYVLRHPFHATLVGCCVAPFACILRRL